MLLGGVRESGTAKAPVYRGWISFNAVPVSRGTKLILEDCERGGDYAQARYEAVRSLEAAENPCARSSSASTSGSSSCAKVAFDCCAIDIPPPTPRNPSDTGPTARAEGASASNQNGRTQTLPRTLVHHRLTDRCAASPSRSSATHAPPNPAPVRRAP